MTKYECDSFRAVGSQIQFHVSLVQGKHFQISTQDFYKQIVPSLAACDLVIFICKGGFFRLSSLTVNPHSEACLTGSKELWSAWSRWLTSQGSVAQCFGHPDVPPLLCVHLG